MSQSATPVQSYVFSYMSLIEVEPFDPLRLQIPFSMVSETPRRRPRLPKHKRGEEFLKGPIPIAWLRCAAQLRGKVLAVAIALWFKAGAQQNSAEVKLSAALLDKLGVKRQAAYRALNALEQSGLVTVKRHPGRCPMVTIQPFSPDSE